MTKFKLTLLSKNHSLFDHYELPLALVPRVGEIIEASALLGERFRGDVSTFFVTSVTYVATRDGLQPHVTALQWFRGFRHEELQRHGWLIPQSVEMLEYDEDEFYPQQR